MASRLPLLAALGTLLSPAVALACSTAATGAGCIEVVATPVLASAAVPTAVAPALASGDVLAPGGFSVLLNAAYYGLPAAADGWVYVRVERQVVRMDWRSRTVIDDVTERAAANF